MPVLWTLSKCVKFKLKCKSKQSASTLTKWGGDQGSSCSLDLSADALSIPQNIKTMVRFNSAQTKCWFYNGWEDPSRIMWCCRTSSGKGPLFYCMQSFHIDCWCLPHVAQMPGIETTWELHTLTVIQVEVTHTFLSHPSNQEAMQSRPQGQTTLRCP